MIAVLDTHAALWCVLDAPQLGEHARSLIAGAPSGSMVLSDITLLEVSMLLAKSRLTVRGSHQRFLSELKSHFHIHPIEPDIAWEAMHLSLPQGDPFDRVITATAKCLGVPLLTRDRAIQKSGCVETVW
jgi:PIN domain nuclease of toxin-antitoxin system